MSYYKKETEYVIKELDTSLEGLDKEIIEQKLEKYGFNKLEEKKKKTLISRCIDQLKDAMIIVLVIASCLSAFVSIMKSEPITDSIIILIVVVLNIILGVMQESKADKAIEALQKMSSPIVKVRRSNVIESIKTEELVPGDIILLEAGDYIPADIRLIETHSFRVIESALTGESEPVDKNYKAISGDDKKIALADRVNMAYSGSHAVYGRCEGVVVATGMNTELGKIAQTLNQIKNEETPLQKRMTQLSKTLSVIVIIIAIIMSIIGIVQNSQLIDVFMLAIALAVAAIPEGLAAVITVSLAIGVQNMSKKNSIVRKLSAVEALGCTEVICSDKTGTLTQNKMTVRKVVLGSDLYESIESSEKLMPLINTMVLCNDSKISSDKFLGDPTETALLEYASKLDIDINAILDENVRIYELPFDSIKKKMTTFNKSKKEGSVILYTKGSLESIITSCNSILINGKVCNLNKKTIDKIHDLSENMSKDALRVLAYAYKPLNKDFNPDKKDAEKLEKDLIFIGLSAMIDPPREEARKAVKECFSAGMTPVMITGDNIVTAKAIALELGIYNEGNEALNGVDLDLLSEEELLEKIENVRVYARVSPENKIRIVKAWKSLGKTVAMTGDGVNDAPALKGADIGIGMGITGTEVTKNVASMVLADDNFATIVTAIKEGRRIYNNIQNAITYLLASNLCEVLIVFFGIFFATGDTNILLPVQILWINLISDTIPALALAFENADKDIMSKKPRKQSEPFFNKFTTSRIISSALIKFVVICIIYLYVDSQFGHLAASSAVFISLAIIEVMFALTCRSDNKSILKLGFFSNRKMAYCVMGTILLQVIVLSNSITSSWLSISPLDKSVYILIMITVIVTFVILEINKLVIAKLFKED